ncbi:MAG: ATP-binding protein [Verrucomicrobiota bacterium]
MKILLIQDRNQKRDARAWLAGSRYQPVVSQNLEQAQSLVLQNEFEVIVLDQGQADESQAFCRWLRTAARRSLTFVLFGLDAVSDEAVDAAVAAGADDVYVRPLSRCELELRLASIRHQLKRQAAWRQTEAALNARAQQQVAVAALGQCALSEDLPTLTDLVTRFIMYTLEVEFCSLCEAQPDGKTVKVTAGFGWRDGWIGQTLAAPPPESLIGRTLAGEDLLVEDLRRDQRFPATDLLREHGVVSGVSVAVKGREPGVYGALGAYTNQPRRFLDDDLRFLEGLANVLGSAIERQRTEAELQKRQSQVQHLQRLESVGQLAAALAHDYNNILTIIHGHITLAVSESRLPPRLAASLKAVLEAVERASRLTRQLLSFSRKQAIELKPVDLNEAVADVGRLLDRVLGNNVRLEIRPCAALPAVRADSGMLDQVLMNLAVNARDAMPSGGQLLVQTSICTITVLTASHHPEARPGEFVCLSVTDSGCGMDETTLRKIFDPFFTTKPAGKGTGLGLSTVYGIVKQHQGWIEVESAPGQGTTFRVMLPSLGVPAAKTPAAPPARKPSAPAAVLLVEDEPGLRDLTRMLLEDLGYAVAEAGSADEALLVWGKEKDRIAILLTDLMLSDGVTGFELAERLRQERPELKVLLTSGYSAEDVSAEFSTRAGFQFLQKPYAKDTLAQTIRDCLESKVAAKVSQPLSR